MIDIKLNITDFGISICLYGFSILPLSIIIDWFDMDTTDFMVDGMAVIMFSIYLSIMYLIKINFFKLIIALSIMNVIYFDSNLILFTIIAYSPIVYIIYFGYKLYVDYKKNKGDKHGFNEP